MSWSTGKYVRYHVIATYNGYLEIIGWSVWDTERSVNVVSTEKIDERNVVELVAEWLNNGVLVHYVEA